MAERGESGGRAADAAEQATRTVKDRSVDINDLRQGWREEMSAMGQEQLQKNPGLQIDKAAEQRAALKGR